MSSEWRNFCIGIVLTIIMCVALVHSGRNETKQMIELERKEYVKATVTPTPTPTPIEVKRVESKYIPVLITYKKMELTSLGKYFITSYCPSECGYNGYNFPTGWMTASDTICHRAEYNYRLSEPTTCAIDRKLHRFGDTFYIPEFDRTFIAEDTGSAVRGHHLDLFYEEYSDVVSFPTGYYEVYAVTWIEETVAVTEEELQLLEESGIIEILERRG